MVLRRRFAFFDVKDILAEYNSSDGGVERLSPRLELFAKELPLTTFPGIILGQSTTRPPKLKHNLDKVLRADGIFPSEGINKLNGNDFISKICDVTQDVMARFGTYKPPSQDVGLQKASSEVNCKFIASSSTLTEALSHIWYSLSNFRSPDLLGLGRQFDARHMNYMSAYRKPVMLMLRRVPGTNNYAVDADHGMFQGDNKILTDLGIVLETMLTQDKDTFLKIMDPNSGLSVADVEEILASSRCHRMRAMGNFLIRSQIDCEYTTPEGENYVFEIKTRACAPIRYDVKNYKDYIDYNIDQRLGVHSSYEREYFDLCRSLLPKYFFQIKLGNMDGAFVAYHNTKKMFGFEYIKLGEIERRLFGSSEFSWVITSACIQVLDKVLEEALKIFPGQEMLKVGLYAHFNKNQLTVTLEQFDQTTEWKDTHEEVEGIEDEFDYYEVHARGKTAYVFTVNLFPYINGVLQREPLFMESGDSLSLQYLVSYRGVMPYVEYMNFLNCAYKMDSIMYNREYTGHWKRFNDFHVFRKYSSAGVKLS
eukprot:CAMPEP_0204908364 /NCGR_PEP_ID=MMETSP1397-20131031/7317_1 /ASSEMBLY_ACC=CAM_ASM_000891 /TAXON_ID=49980 /ORGANISM="Climacostomum Climacostomum virens, Strain Stock W-24" /LENGTH=535 /DNA_ID=CAMNT_0052077849 /DNA_START=513 /DNA_END=2120 /DNA_ORIENTATION=+